MSDERPEDVAGDAADDDTVSMQAIEPEPAGPTAASRSVSLLATIAVAAALASVVFCGILFWQYRAFDASLADADEQAQAALERSRIASEASADALERLERDIEQNAQALRALDDRLESVPGRFADVERRMDAIVGGSFDARNEWLAEEASYYLGAANSELQLGGRWDNALAALRLADERLREIGDPGLAAVREQIADEIIALESVRLVDIEGLAHSLSRLSARVSELPLRVAGQNDAAEPDGVSEPEAGLARLWSSITSAFSGIVRVERRDESALAALSVDEQRLIRRQLSVELQTARLALVSGEAAIFRSSLEHAGQLLREDFDAGAGSVEGGLRLVESLLDLDIAPTPPDISRSLAMLRARGEP
ncbi:MAG: uroporphyrinogen-III C-methyltransferase [Gammaproteobacteria bacterium]|jgi:uroporphyrin-3 C-methyltransferase